MNAAWSRAFRPLALCTIGGVSVAMALPPWGFWPLAFVGYGCYEYAVSSCGARDRALYGFLFAFAWLGIGMAWMWFLSAPGYVIATAAFSGVHALGAAIAPAGRWGAMGRSAAHTLAEYIRWTVPFGGVPLATVPMALSGSPLIGLARVGGGVLMVWFVFATAATVAAAVTERTLTPQRVVTVALALSAVVASLVAPSGRDIGETRDIAAVQGGGRQGTSALQVPSDVVTAALVTATETISPDGDLDFVVWPENGIAVWGMPFVDSAPYLDVANQARRLGVPFVVGVTHDSEYAIEPRPGAFVNAQVVVDPDGDMSSRYEKVRIVPFGEYVPFRALLQALGVDLSLVSRDAVPGRDPAQVSVDGPHGTTRVGVMISWEVFFAWRGRAAAANGSEVLINPTNAASYTGTIVQSQQVASSRLRAVENGRWVVQVAPTGFTAFVEPDGTVIDRSAVSEQTVLRHPVFLRSGATWYRTTGDGPLVVAALTVLVAAVAASRRAATHHQATDHQATDDEATGRRVTRPSR